MEAAGWIRCDVTKRLMELMCEHAGPVELDREADLLDQLGLDSLGLVELLAAVEDAFEVEFEREEIVALRSFGDVARVVAGKLADAERRRAA